ncbi:hypothetical protein [Streptosporangium sp. NPDC001681]
MGVQGSADQGGEIGYSAELADDTSAVFTPEELADNGIALMI